MIKKEINKFLFFIVLCLIYIYLSNAFIKKISVAYGLNNNYFFQTYISIISILENSFSSTFYIRLLMKKIKKSYKI